MMYSCPNPSQHIPTIPNPSQPDSLADIGRKVDFGTADVPKFLAPSAEPGDGLCECPQLQKNAEVVLNLMGLQKTRNVMFAMDETVYFPQYGLLHVPEPVYVGGADEKAVIPAGEGDAGHLKKTDLAQTCLSFVVSFGLL